MLVTDSDNPFSIHSFLVIFFRDMLSPLATCLMSQQLEYLNQDKIFISLIYNKSMGFYKLSKYLHLLFSNKRHDKRPE